MTTEKRLALLVNPASGKGRQAALGDQVAERLRRGFEVTSMSGTDAASSAALARQAVRDGYDALVVMGGDGIVHLALQAVSGTTTTLGIVPTGTGNDVARAIGLPPARPIEAADVILDGGSRTIDLANATLSDGTTAHYATVLAAGFDSLVNERANSMRWPSGQMRYNLATLAELRVFRPLAYTLVLDGARRQCEAMLVAVGNTASYGGGLRMCEGASIDDGLLDVVIIKPISKLELVKVYPRLFKGTHVTHPAYERVQVRNASIEVADVVGYADGERLGPLPGTVDVLPRAVTVFAPSR